jgi:hypothetical protein
MLKRNGMLKGFLLVLAFAVATIAVINVEFAQSQQQAPQPAPLRMESYEEHMAIVTALRRGGLREAARIKRSFVRPHDPNSDWLRLDLEKLTKNSEAVIVGVPVKSICELTPDGQLITTNYDVIVQEVLKGDLMQGSTIKVALLGGKITFDDGSTAEVVTPGFDKMVNDRSYTLYLSRYPIRSPIYDLTAGPQGMIELPADNTSVKSQARETDPVKKHVEDKDRETFLREARELARKWPVPSKCCTN